MNVLTIIEEKLTVKLETKERGKQVKMPAKKCGYPLLHGDSLDEQMKAYVKASQAKGCVVIHPSLLQAGWEL